MSSDADGGVGVHLGAVAVAGSAALDAAKRVRECMPVRTISITISYTCSAIIVIGTAAAVVAVANIAVAAAVPTVTSSSRCNTGIAAQ